MTAASDSLFDLPLVAGIGDSVPGEAAETDPGDRAARVALDPLAALIDGAVDPAAHWVRTQAPTVPEPQPAPALRRAVRPLPRRALRVGLTIAAVAACLVAVLSGRSQDAQLARLSVPLAGSATARSSSSDRFAARVRVHRSPAGNDGRTSAPANGRRHTSARPRHRAPSHRPRPSPPPPQTAAARPKPPPLSAPPPAPRPPSKPAVQFSSEFAP